MKSVNVLRPARLKHVGMTMLAIMLLSLTGFAVTAAAAQPLKNIRVVMDDNYPPYVFKDEQGELKGIIIDQWRQWEKKTGIRAELKGMDWGEAQSRMQAGEFDVIDTIFKTEKREATLDFSRPYAKIDFSIFLHNDISGIRDVKDLKGFLVGVKSGGAVIDILKKSGIENIAAYPRDLSIVEAARDSKIKVFVMGDQSALYFLNRMQIAADYRQSGDLFTAEFHRAVGKGRHELLKVVEKGFSDISASEYKDIDTRWMGKTIGGALQLRYLWYLAGAVLLTGVLVFSWIMVLRRAVRNKTGELAASEERYRSIIDNMQDVYYRSDAEGRLTMISPSGIELMGYGRADQMLGLIIRDTFYYDPQERDAFIHNLKMKGHLSGYEVTLRRKDGTPVPVATSTHLMFAPDGSFAGVEGVFRDISRQQEAEAALRASEQKFSKSFSKAPLLMTISDIQTGYYLEVNESFCKISGFSRDESIGRTSLELGWISATERNRLLGILKQDGRVHEVEVPLTAKDGRQVICLYSAEVISADGADRLLSIALDITERKKDLDALDYANECFQQALGSPQHMLYRLNVKRGGYDYMSPSAERITGRPLDLLKQIRLEELAGFFHPDDRERIFALIEERRLHAEGDRFGLELEYRFRKPDDSYCWLHDSTTVCLDNQGQLDYFFGSAYDITERKQTEELLTESEERYRRLVEQSSAWIWRTDTKLKHVYSNDNVERILGYTADELCAMDILSLVHPEDHEALRKTAEQAINSRRAWEGLVLRWLARDGGWRSIESSGVPIVDDDGVFAGLMGVDTDVTARLQLQHEQDKGQRLESLGLLAGGIAHDFNNILTGIVGNLSLARMMIDSGHRAAGRLEECEKAAKRASELTQQLLTFSRGGEPVKKVVDSARLLKEVVPFGLHGSNVKAILELADGLWPVYADEGQISQVFNNLLINASQAMPDGGTVTVRADNCECESAGGRFVRLSVKDTGGGIPPEILPRVFDPYFTTKKGGSGLGLASVYSIVTRHGGEVNVSSVMGYGTEFVIMLPAAESSGVPEQSGEPVPAGQCIAEKVLVMDDEEVIREVASLILAELGCGVETCRDGTEALELYRRALEQGTPYDAVILDLTIPGGMGGLDAATRIRSLDPGATLIVSSGYSQDAVMADFQSYGFSGSVMKPYSMDTMCNELARVMGTKGLRAQ